MPNRERYGLADDPRLIVSEYFAHVPAAERHAAAPECRRTISWVEAAQGALGAVEAWAAVAWGSDGDPPVPYRRGEH